MLDERPTSFVNALSYTNYRLAWVPEYHDVSLVIYRFYPYGSGNEPCYGLFALREGRPPMLMVVTFRLWIMEHEMDKHYIPHEALDWQHEPPYGMTELPQLSYEEGKVLVMQWLREHTLAIEEHFQYQRDFEYYREAAEEEEDEEKDGNDINYMEIDFLKEQGRDN